MVSPEIVSNLIQDNNLLENPSNIHKLNLDSFKSNKYEIYDKIMEQLILKDPLNFNHIGTKQCLSYFNLLKFTLASLLDTDIDKIIPQLNIHYKFISVSDKEIFDFLVKYSYTNLVIHHSRLASNFNVKLLKEYIDECITKGWSKTVIRVLYIFNKKINDKSFYDETITKLIENKSNIERKSSLREINPFFLKYRSTYTKLCNLFVDINKSNIKYVIPQLLSSKEEYQSLVDKSLLESWTNFNYTYADSRFLTTPKEVTLSKRHYFNIVLLKDGKKYLDSDFINNTSDLIPNFDDKKNRLYLYSFDILKDRLLNSVDIFNTDELKSGYDWFSFLDTSEVVPFDRAQNELNQMKNQAKKDKEKSKGGIHGMKRGSNATKAKKRR
jgi:hypothetical protein